MKKKEIDVVVNVLKHSTSKRLSRICSEMARIPAERELTKSMYFWKGPGNAYNRNRFESRYSEDYTIALTKELSIHYRRSVNPSRNYAYAYDYLTSITPDGEIDITCADVKKLIAGIEEILSARGINSNH